MDPTELHVESSSCKVVGKRKRTRSNFDPDEIEKRKSLAVGIRE